MKKFFVLLFSVLFLFSLQAQEDHSIIKANSSQPSSQRDASGIDCPSGTYYSHPVNLSGGFTSSQMYRVFDQIETTPSGAVRELTFFGNIELYDPSRTFEIGFYHDNAGLPGTAFKLFSSTLTGTYTGFSGWGNDIYRYTYQLPEDVTVNAGDWISIFAQGDWWYWCMASAGDGCVYQQGNAYRCDYGDVAFCLGPTQGVVPVSPWAIALGISLIAVAVILRTRRMI